MSDETAANLHLWENWADLHMAGSHYDVEGFIADPAVRPFGRVIREVVGDVAGRRLLHLQCHIGIDTLPPNPYALPAHRWVVHSRGGCYSA